MKIENEIKLDYADVLLAPKWSDLSSRNDAELSLIREFKMPHSQTTWTGMPIIASNMDHTGTLAMANALAKHSCMTALHKFHNKEDVPRIASNGSLAENSWITIGCNGAAAVKLNEMAAAARHFKYINPKICIDVANAHTEDFRNFVSEVRHAFPEAVIMAGNVASPSVTQALILAGADIVKIGIGPGAVCTTRRITGVGYPQLSAVMECADAAHGMNAHICADGGCVVPGDIAKAFGGGADFVMLGSMLAGTNECDGALDEMRPHDVQFYGMSSKVAQEKHYGSLKEYRAAEGKEVWIKRKGPVNDVILEIFGGLRSCMTYIGAKNLKDIHKCATFIRVNRQLNESLK